jgi:hypothetical protein
MLHTPQPFLPEANGTEADEECDCRSRIGIPNKRRIAAGSGQPTPPRHKPQVVARPATALRHDDQRNDNPVKRNKRYIPHDGFAQGSGTGNVVRDGRDGTAPKVSYRGAWVADDTITVLPLITAGSTVR